MKLMILMLGSYLVGNVLTAKWLGKWFFGADLQQSGSGNPGARNAGRVLGKRAFIITFIGDACKGALVVIIARFIGLSEGATLLVLGAAICGHNYPILYRFKGGQGVSTFLGGLITFSPLLTLCFAVVFGFTYPFLKSFTLSGMIAVASLPFIGLIIGQSGQVIVGWLIVCGLILFAHRHDLKEKLVRNRKKGLVNVEKIQSMGQWYELLEQSNNEPVFILKHSVTCPISSSAYFAYNEANTSIKKYVVIVQDSRPISNEITQNLDVKHESPQAILVQNGEAVWHASHYKITKETIQSVSK